MYDEFVTKVKHKSETLVKRKSVWMITALLITTPSNIYFLIFCFSSFCWVFALLYYFFDTILK